MRWPEAEVSLPTDRDGYVRRECPRCERAFKTLPTGSDGFCLHAHLTRSFPQANLDEVDAEVDILSCLYCGQQGAVDDFLTEEQLGFLKALGESLLSHLQYEQLAYVGRTLGANPSPTFVPVPPPPLITSMEDEPDDMEEKPLGCCGEVAKGYLTWRGALHCPTCGTEHVPEGRRRPLEPTARLAALA